MAQYHVRVNDYGQHQVYATSNGIDRVDQGPPFETPRGAIFYSEQLEAEQAKRAAERQLPELEDIDISW